MGFEFATALTLVHTITTMAGMMVFCYMGMFVPKQVSVLQVSQYQCIVQMLCCKQHCSCLCVWHKCTS